MINLKRLFHLRRSKRSVIPECPDAVIPAKAGIHGSPIKAFGDDIFKHAGMTRVFLIVVLIMSLCKFSVAFAEEFSYDSHGKKDPFVSPAQAHTGGQLGTGELKLEGVIVDAKGGSYAIVNGEIVREGDHFEGFSLKKVEQNRAIFDKDGEVLEVVLRQDDEALKQYLEDHKSGQ